MTHKRIGTSKPQRLTDFFTHPQHGGRQNGAGSSSTPATKHEDKTHKKDTSPQHSDSPDSLQSYPSSPPSGSLAKAKFRLDGAGCSPTMSPITDTGDDTRELPESITSFRTMNQPVMDTVLKDMLVSLRSTLQADMINCMHRFSGEIKAVESKVEHIEGKMREFASTIN